MCTIKKSQPASNKNFRRPRSTNYISPRKINIRSVRSLTTNRSKTRPIHSKYPPVITIKQSQPASNNNYVRSRSTNTFSPRIINTRSVCSLKKNTSKQRTIHSTYPPLCAIKKTKPASNKKYLIHIRSLHEPQNNDTYVRATVPMNTSLVHKKVHIQPILHETQAPVHKKRKLEYLK